MLRPLCRALPASGLVLLSLIAAPGAAGAHPAVRPAPPPLPPVMARPVVSLPQPSLLPGRAAPAVAPRFVAVRPLRRPPPAFVPGFAGGFVPVFATRPVVVVREVAPQPVSQQITISRLTVAPGIRRAPEAAPVIYRIDDIAPSRRFSPQAQGRPGQEWGRDTTLPRIVQVRTR
jgi:hypothetical protein